MAVISYKCPNCGGDLRFDPQTQEYKCEYCISQFSQSQLDEHISAAGQQEEKKAAEQENSGQDGQAVVYTCPSCGAEIVTDETTAASFCYYCHNPVVLQGRLAGEFLPNKVIPFKVTKEEAIEEFLSVLNKKKFIPKAFFAKDQIEKVSGVYFPYWLSEHEVDGSMNAAATNIRVWRVGDIEYTETRYYDVERAGSMHFREMTKNALKKANRQLVEGVQPFPLEACQDFTMGYLSGFQAEKWDISKAELNAEVENEIKGYATTLLRESIHGYATVNPRNTNVQVRDGKWDYVLLPVWTLTYKGKDDTIYYYALNGATKKVFGKLPIDYKKIAAMSGVIFAVVFLLGLLGGYLI